MTEALRIVTATARRYFAGDSDLTKRRRLMLSLIQQKGRVSFNENGASCFWNVKFSEPTPQDYGSGAEFVYSEHDSQRQLEIDWRAFLVTNKLEYRDSLLNRGDVAIIEYYKRILPDLRSSLNNTWHKMFYEDASSNPLRPHGLKTFLKFNTPTAADRIATPDNSATYGGKDIQLQTEGGTWSSALTVKPNATLAYDWPEGTGTPEFDYLGGLGVNASSTNWGTDSTDWRDNCGTVFRNTTNWLMKNCGDEGRPTLYICANDRFTQYQDYQEAKFRNIMPHAEARDLGFPDTLNQDGVMIKSEFDVPAGEVYGVNIDKLQLACNSDQIWDVRGPVEDPRTGAYLFRAGFFGNMRFQPKFFALIKDFA